MKIIGLTGFAKSGKSTAARILTELGGQEVAFADHLKNVCADITRVPRNHFDDQDKKEVPFHKPYVLTEKELKRTLDLFALDSASLLKKPELQKHIGMILKTPRHVAQYIGTDVLRAINPDIHITTAFKFCDPNAIVLFCSDVRFQNEFDAVHARNGIMLGISRKAVSPQDLAKVHESERWIPELIEKSDYKVTNDGTIEEFQQKVRSIVADFIGGNA